MAGDEISQGVDILRMKIGVASTDWCKREAPTSATDERSANHSLTSPLAIARQSLNTKTIAIGFQVRGSWYAMHMRPHGVSSAVVIYHDRCSDMHSVKSKQLDCIHFRETLFQSIVSGYEIYTAFPNAVCYDSG